MFYLTCDTKHTYVFADYSPKVLCHLGLNLLSEHANYDIMDALHLLLA